MTPRQRLTLLAPILGSALATIDGSIVNVALPAVERDLGDGLPAPPHPALPQEGLMDDSQVHGTIEQLVQEEQELWQREANGTATRR